MPTNLAVPSTRVFLQAFYRVFDLAHTAAAIFRLLCARRRRAAAARHRLTATRLYRPKRMSTLALERKSDEENKCQRLAVLSRIVSRSDRSSAS